MSGSVPDFPTVDTDALVTCASGLLAICEWLDGVGVDVTATSSAVVGSQVWASTAAQQWQAVLADRVGDTRQSVEALGQAAALLRRLAADIEIEHSTYNGLLARMAYESGGTGGYGIPGGPVGGADPTTEFLAALNESVGRANDLLNAAGSNLLDLAALADGIHAQLAANRTPGVADGTDRNAASLNLLAILFGSVRDNQVSGSGFENTVLQALGLTKNTQTYRPATPFDGKETKGGLPKGTIPDADVKAGPEGPGFLIEVKNTNNLSNSFQIQLEAQYGDVTERPLWIIERQGAEVSPQALATVEKTNGGVIYRTPQGGYVDGNGDPVDVQVNGSQITVGGYRPSTAKAAPALSEPTAPLDPGTEDPPGGGDPAAPGGPDIGKGPADGVDPYTEGLGGLPDFIP